MQRKKSANTKLPKPKVVHRPYNYYDDTLITKKDLPWVTPLNCMKAAIQTVFDPKKGAIHTVEGNFTKSLNHGRNFFKHVIIDKTIPTVQNFIDYYWNKNTEGLYESHRKYYNHLNEQEFFEGVEARCYRAGIGFLTELHAYSLVEEYFPEYNIIKTIRLDSSGIDWMMETPNKTFAIRFFVKNPRASKYAAGKLDTFPEDKLVSIVNLTYGLDDPGVTLLPNGFVLCSSDHMERLRSIINGSTKPKIRLNFYSA